MEYEIKIYSTEEGKEPFRDWLDSLKDVDTQALIFQRLQRIKLGNFGDCKPISEGLSLEADSCIGLRSYCNSQNTSSLVLRINYHPPR